METFDYNLMFRTETDHNSQDYFKSFKKNPIGICGLTFRVNWYLDFNSRLPLQQYGGDQISKKNFINHSHDLYTLHVKDLDMSVKACIFTADDFKTIFSQVMEHFWIKDVESVKIIFQHGNQYFCEEYRLTDLVRTSGNIKYEL